MGSGGSNPATLIADIGTRITNINTYMSELDSTELYDSSYTIQKIKDKATEAINTLTEAKANLEVLNSNIKQ